MKEEEGGGGDENFTGGVGFVAEPFEKAYCRVIVSFKMLVKFNLKSKIP